LHASTARRRGGRAAAWSMSGDADLAGMPTPGVAAAAAAVGQPSVKDEPVDAEELVGIGTGGGGADLSRFDELMRIYTEPYDAADTELAEGMRLRRRQSAERLAKFPRLLAKVKKDAKAGRREDVVRTLTLVERWMTSHPAHAKLLPREIARLMVRAGAAGAGEEEEEEVKVYGFVDLSDEPDLVDMETWVLAGAYTRPLYYLNVLTFREIS